MSQHQHRSYCRCHLAVDFTSPGAVRHYPPDLVLEPVHREIRLWVDVEGRSAKGQVTTTYEARAAGGLEVEFDAVNLEIEEVSEEGVEGEAQWQYDGQKLKVRWGVAPQKGEQRRVTVKYSVKDPASGLYFSSPTHAEPSLPRFAVTDHETERARHWLPCLDLPAARTKLDFYLRAAKDLTILANGSLVSEMEHEDGTHTAHWRLEQPCPSYLTCFAIGDFVRVDEAPYEGRPVAYFTTHAFTQDDLKRSFGRTPQMLAWMEKKLGYTFPYPKYFQFAVPGIGGAMENISLVSWDDMFVLDAPLAKEWDQLVDQINVHEMAHSYFGDLVVCREFAHAWLKETWATYMELCWFEDHLGEDEHLYEWLDQVNGYLAEADNRYQRPIVTRTFNSSWNMYDAHLYPGGSCRMHTLRHEIGDEAFWGAVSDYIHAHAFKTVETEDLRRAFEARSGRSLTKFFDQWLYSPGFPNIKAGFDYDQEHRRGTFTFEQTQADEAKGVPVFELSLQLVWIVEGVRSERTVKLTQAHHQVVVDMEGPPSQVLIDPWGKTLHRLDFNPGLERLKTQLQQGPSVLARIHAAQALAKQGGSVAVETLAAALASEPFWGVRVELCRALSKVGSQAALAALASGVREEQHPRALANLFLAAGKWREPILSAALVERVERGDLPPRALAAAFEALGAQRGGAPWELLLAAAQTKRPLDIAQSGAIRALAATRRADAALPVVMGLSKPGVSSDRIRRATAEALSELYHHLPTHQREPVVEHLCDMLRDPSIRVRRAAHAGLRGTGDTRALGPLNAFRAPLSKQEQVDVERTIAAIYAAQHPSATGSERALDDLRDAQRKLEERLRALEAELDGRHDDKTPPASPRTPSGEPAKG